MGCCSGKGCDEFFTDRVARRDASRYRRRGLDGNAQRLVNFVRTKGVDGKTVLEVGGGVGAIQLELLRAGASSAANAELSPAYEHHAAELADEAGLAGRTERHLLDFAQRGNELEDADVVVLHKVVCCYPDYVALVGAASAHTRDQLALTFPRNAAWTRIGFAAMNAVQRLRRRSFRVYLHPPTAIIAVASSHGLQQVTHHTGLMWEFAGLTRSGEATARTAESPHG